MKVFSLDVRRYAAAALAAAALLTGQVTDRTTGQALPGISIAVAGSRATTDRNGRYTIKDAKPGKWTLTAASDDVPAQRFSVTIGTGRTERNLRVCSTTLDYNCGAPLNAPGNS